MFVLLMAGPMTVTVYLYVRGVELCGLGPTGMIFYLPTLQFLLGYFLYNEPLNMEKLISLFLFGLRIYLRIFINN